MRRGFSLVEMLVVIVILPVVFVILAGLFRTLLTDIPWSCRITQENTILLSVLEHMQQDIDKARGLPESFAGHTASDKLLLIELADGVICYQLEDGQVVRYKLTDSQQDNAEEERVWSLPHAKVEWQVWASEGEGYAVEAKAHVEHRIRGRWKKKMTNSHLYFVGAF